MFIVFKTLVIKSLNVNYKYYKMIIIIKFILPKYHTLIDFNKNIDNKNIDLYWLCNTSVTPMTPIIKDKLLEKVTERIIEYFK